MYVAWLTDDIQLYEIIDCFIWQNWMIASNNKSVWSNSWQIVSEKCRQARRMKASYIFMIERKQNNLKMSSIRLRIKLALNRTEVTLWYHVFVLL